MGLGEVLSASSGLSGLVGGVSLGILASRLKDVFIPQ